MNKKAKQHAKRVVILTLGVVSLALGLVGLVLPFLNGIIFLVISLVLFSVYSVTAKNALQKIGKQHHKMEKAVAKVEAWVAKVVGDVD